MNIFFLDQDPAKAAEYHCDKHVIKMILESAQMLSTYWRKQGKDVGYKKTHENHPCVLWLEQNPYHYEWLRELAKNLNQEYIKRYNNGGHKSWDVIRGLPRVIKHQIHWGDEHLLWFCLHDAPLCMPDKYKDYMDIVESYRNYYIGEKSDFCTWKNSEKPYWYPKTLFDQ